MRMKCLRIFPETMPRISWPEPSSLSLNIAFGNAVVTTASTSMASDFATGIHSAELSDGDKGTRHGSCKPLGEQAGAAAGGKSEIPNQGFQIQDLSLRR